MSDLIVKLTELAAKLTWGGLARAAAYGAFLVALLWLYESRGMVFPQMLANEAAPAAVLATSLLLAALRFALYVRQRFDACEAEGRAMRAELAEVKAELAEERADLKVAREIVRLYRERRAAGGGLPHESDFGRLIDHLEGG